MSVEGQVQIRMKASVGTLRSQDTYWVEEGRAATLVGRFLAAYVVEPEPVSVIDAIASVAAEMRDQHRLAVASADPPRDATAAPERTKEAQEDGSQSDESAGKARTRSRARNGNGTGDKAGRLDEPAD